MEIQEEILKELKKLNKNLEEQKNAPMPYPVPYPYPVPSPQLSLLFMFFSESIRLWILCKTKNTF